MSRIRFNMSQTVLVKLTPLGKEELRRQHDILRKTVPNIGEFKLPDADDEGYSRFQLWRLMEHFGHLIHLGCPVPFETDIFLDPES